MKHVFILVGLVCIISSCVTAVVFVSDTELEGSSRYISRGINSAIQR